jgi:hypothetical protein
LLHPAYYFFADASDAAASCFSLASDFALAGLSFCALLGLLPAGDKSIVAGGADVSARSCSALPEQPAVNIKIKDPQQIYFRMDCSFMGLLAAR